MEAISVFDIFKVGVGPSSSHTIGPWRAALRFVAACGSAGVPSSVRVDLYGSLAKTGRGHGTDVAVMMGLLGEDPETCDTSTLGAKIEAVRASKSLRWNGSAEIPFDPAKDLISHFDESLPFHPNGMRLSAEFDDVPPIVETYYSIGGGFIVKEGESPGGSATMALPMPIETAEDLERHCARTGLSIPEVVRANERAWRSDGAISSGLDRIWTTMRDCVHRGCLTEGVLPGGLKVTRRAAALGRSLLGGEPSRDVQVWMDQVRASARDFAKTLRWISAFALAVNEENASFGRVVTAPTNGAAGVIPAVLMYDVLFNDCEPAGIADFLLTAGEVGSVFKKGATLSAAMGGCQAEIGVSSAMAASALCQRHGGTVEQVLMAAEIAMEHHLGLTCDPVGGLVQIPCIERNAMGAIKAVTAANLALAGDPGSAKVPLDAVIRTMWQTALDMNGKYKETSEGGLAVQIPVNIIEC